MMTVTAIIPELVCWTGYVVFL